MCRKISPADHFFGHRVASKNSRGPPRGEAGRQRSLFSCCFRGCFRGQENARKTSGKQRFPGRRTTFSCQENNVFLTGTLSGKQRFPIRKTCFPAGEHVFLCFPVRKTLFSSTFSCRENVVFLSGKRCFPVRKTLFPDRGTLFSCPENVVFLLFSWCFPGPENSPENNRKTRASGGQPASVESPSL